MRVALCGVLACCPLAGSDRTFASDHTQERLDHARGTQRHAVRHLSASVEPRRYCDAAHTWHEPRVRRLVSCGTGNAGTTIGYCAR
jgi:hypothetical protein